VATQKLIIFDPFSLDLTNECLWDGTQAIKVRPKPFAVLQYLIARSGKLVTKDELLNAIWPGTFVGEAVLKVAIRQLREVLRDDPKSPRFIETAHRRGYRFIGEIAESGPIQEETKVREDHRAVSDISVQAADFPSRIVGRDQVLLEMRTWLEKMRRGERQIVFVTGEAGIGKTAVVDAFAESIASDDGIRIGRGQCLEQYGTSEAYLPVLDAIGRLCREHRQVIDVIRAHAPMWLLQMPSLVSASDHDLLSREVSGATRERMLREMGDALEALTTETPLVLILEDLHWSDYSTLDLISYIARQRHSARLMLIGTYRTVELIVSGHPLKAVKQELLAKQQCRELPLEYLSEDAVHEYLSVRFPRNRFPLELVRLIHQRTEGNALFMINLVDYLVAEESIRQHDNEWELVAAIERVDVAVPESIKQMIEKQVDHLNATDQEMLEAASVAGTEFSSPVLAAGLAQDRTVVEIRCDQLARYRQFIHDCGVHVLPSGEAIGRYGFIHALYQNVLYERLLPARRVQLHRRIAEKAEAVYGEHAGAIAAELEMHFELAGDYKRAAKYLQHAADNANQRFGYEEAVKLARKGLTLLRTLPDDRERAEQELGLQLSLGVPLTASRGYADPQVGGVYLRARQLCHQLGETTDVSKVLWGLWTFYTVRAELTTAREIGHEVLQMGERRAHAELSMRGHLALQATLLHMGDFGEAMVHFEKGLLLCESYRHEAADYSQTWSVSARCHAAWALWFLGEPAQALARIDEALTLAREVSEPHALAQTLYFSSMVHHFRGEDKRAQERAEAAIAISDEHGLTMWQTFATIAKLRARIKQGLQEEPIEAVRRAMAAYEATGTEIGRPHLLALLGEAMGNVRQTKDGLRLLEDALELAHRKNQGCYLAELFRIKGELLLNLDSPEPMIREAESCFREAIRVAQQQKAKSWELRAAMSMARLYQNHGRSKKSRSLLAEAFGRFTEGFDTIDLREAKALLGELS
jgi:DNA-binding winged helix-turn-helix (wHTH) protein/tetratricopeptide (TPR) repeat protein